MTQPKKNIISIVGTTGVGKSQFSIELAKAIGGEIINADSMQVYKGLDNITNKHPVEEREGVPHWMMDHVKWDEEYFIHRFAEEATKAIEDIHARGKVPIVIGGTHYYLSTLLFRNKTVGVTEEKVRKTDLTEEQVALLDGPVEPIFAALKEIDPVIAQKFHPQDKRKLRRALEIYMTTGDLPSKLYHVQKLDELEDSSLKYNTLLFWVYSDPEILNARLDARVDKMMESGAMDEIKQMYQVYKQQSPIPDCTRGIWQVIGFKEFLPWLTNPDIPKSFGEGVERMKIRTRQYAKYQVKWIKKLLSVELHKEERFDYKYGGKLYLLDATDLDNWSANVAKIGVGIAQQFLGGGPTSVKQPQAPAHLQHVFPDSLDTLKSNKKLGSESAWTHYTCSICRDKQGNPLVAVGDENWKVHLDSRRHKRSIGAGAKKRKHEEMIQKYGTNKKQENTPDNTNTNEEHDIEHPR